MYGFKDQFDWSRLVTRTIDSITYAANAIWLGFDDHLSVQLMTDFGFSDSADAHFGIETVGGTASRLLPLIGDKVGDIELVGTSLLVVRFVSGRQLNLRENESFESFEFSEASQRAFV